MAEDRAKIMIDTDCGIDDAIAIMLALNSKEIAETVAITCVFGNTKVENVCENVKRVLSTCNEKEIPIYVGSEGPLIKREAPVTVHGDDGLGNVSTGFSTGDIKEKEMIASVAMINLSKKFPRQITLIAIGPLTNVALAHRLDKNFTKRLKSLAIMGGNYKGIGNTTEVAEFNFHCDPEAANIVLTEAMCPIVLVPWETTMEYGIKWAVYNELKIITTTKGDFFRKITAFAEKRGREKGNDQLYNCDFLAVVAILYPESVKSSFQRKLRVECEGKLTKGMTILMRDLSNTVSETSVCIITDFCMEFLNSTMNRILS